LRGRRAGGKNRRFSQHNRSRFGGDRFHCRKLMSSSSTLRCSCGCGRLVCVMTNSLTSWGKGEGLRLHLARSSSVEILKHSANTSGALYPRHTRNGPRGDKRRVACHNFRFARCWGAIPRRIGTTLRSCGGVISTTYRLFAKGSSLILPFRSQAISKLVCPKNRTAKPLQPLSRAPLNSGGFSPFRLKVVSDAARSRRYEIGLR